MRQAPQIPELLENVRPMVRNMRMSGYNLQTNGGATRKVIENLGSETKPYYRVEGVPLHAASTNLKMDIEVEFSKQRTVAEDVTGGIFTLEDQELPIGSYVDAVLPDDLDDRIDRCIEHCISECVLNRKTACLIL